ncbi:glycosyltransferase family 4 protein, partial [Escherichia coli]|nr:glycosyltransferase family 4 protein [Escherichia coli]EGF6468725.1 glycosyltransferase family 4 protein [Escherichia coli]EGQ6732895.1 glycosyltransferase family 4 protein [Escherichia coli]HDL6832547.1 glycosyltransferase family 4 protein [Escherichia coli 229_11]
KCNYRKEFNIPDDGILAGSCANLTKRKGIDLVIQTLTKEHKIYYIVAGNGIEKHNLINLVKARKLHERVYFIDFLDEPESFMSQLDVFLMPSRSEGFGLTVLESTKLGIPVITSNIPIFMELFDQMCLTFDIKNPSTLIDVITYAKKNRLHLSQKFHAIFQDRFTSSKMATKYENVYNNLFREVL